MANRNPNMDTFQGDMSRNEVEIDLQKFMEMVSEIVELKAQILEMETKAEPDNPYQKGIQLTPNKMALFGGISVTIVGLITLIAEN